MDNSVIVHYQGAPVEESIGPVANALAAQPLLVAAKPAENGELDLAVATDKVGHLWIYVFTDQMELSRAFPQGSAFVEMAFLDVLNTVGPDERFGGIFVNSSSAAPYLIPHALFAVAYRAISNPPTA